MISSRRPVSPSQRRFRKYVLRALGRACPATLCRRADTDNSEQDTSSQPKENMDTQYKGQRRESVVRSSKPKEDVLDSVKQRSVNRCVLAGRIPVKGKGSVAPLQLHTEGFTNQD